MSKNLIGPQVRAYRLEQELTQDELAHKCNLAGWDITSNTISKIEGQIKKVSDQEVTILAAVLQIEVAELYEPDPVDYLFSF